MRTGAPPCARTAQLDADVHRLRGAVDLPGVGPSEPVVGPLDLPAALDLLAEDAVLVAQAVPDGGDGEGGHRVEEAGGEAAEAAVAEPGVGLLLAEPVEVHAQPPGRLAHERLDEEVDEVVGRRPADEELHREVVDLLGVLAVVDLPGLQPALGEQVAERPRQRLEPLARGGVPGPDDVVEHQVPVVGGVRVAGELDRPAAVPLQEVRGQRPRDAGGRAGSLRVVFMVVPLGCCGSLAS